MCIYGDVKQTMFSEQRKHMIEEANTGMGFNSPVPSTFNVSAIVCFAGGTANRGMAGS
jgi:hypothetical protein